MEARTLSGRGGLRKIKNVKRIYGITDSQLFSLLICTIVGAGVTTLPRTAAQQAGPDGWISIIIGGVVIWLITGLIYLLCRRFPNKTLPQFSIKILGRPLGILVTCLYIVYALFLGGNAMRIFVDLAKTWTMLWTPYWAFLLSILVVVVYTTRLGASTLARLSELILIGTIPALLLFLLPLKEFELLNLTPVGGEGINAIVRGVPEAAFAYLGFEILVIFFPLLINRERVFRIYTLALATVTAFYALNALLIYGVLGVEQTTLQVWPLINYLRIGTSPVLERVDNIFLFIWTAQVFGVTVIQYFVATFAFATLTGKSRHDLWALLFAPVLYIISRFPDRLTDVIRVSDIVGIWGTVFLVSITVIMLLVAVIRGLDERKEDNA